jgi:hypothetical protein
MRPLRGGLRIFSMAAWDEAQAQWDEPEEVCNRFAAL